MFLDSSKITTPFLPYAPKIPFLAVVLIKLPKVLVKKYQTQRFNELSSPVLKQK